jgi:hypothetical protein
MDLVTLLLATLWLGQRKQISIAEQSQMPQAVRYHMLYGVKPELQAVCRDRRLDPVRTSAGHREEPAPAEARIELAKYRKAFAAAGRRSPC